MFSKTKQNDHMLLKCLHKRIHNPRLLQSKLDFCGDFTVSTELENIKINLIFEKFHPLLNVYQTIRLEFCRF